MKRNMYKKKKTNHLSKLKISYPFY